MAVILKRVGGRTLEMWRLSRDTAAVVWEVMRICVHAKYWPRTVRQVWVRQIVFTGVDALGLVVLIAILAGMSVVAQAQVWLNVIGQSGLIGPILVAVIIREVGPLLVNFIVISRSGTAIATELAGMQVRREMSVLDGQGISPMNYLVMPRVTAVAISVLVLSVVFVAVSLISGYFFCLLLGVTSADPALYAANIFKSMAPADVMNFFAKTILPGFATGIITCVAGLRVAESVTEVPRAAARGVVRALAALLVISALVSVLTYA